MKIYTLSGEPDPGAQCGVYTALVDDQLRTTDDPCGWWCTLPQFRGWKDAARKSLQGTITGRPDLPAAIREQLKTMLHDVDMMVDAMAGNTARVQQLARIYQFSECVARWDKVGDPPVVPDPIPDSPDPKQWIALGIAAMAVFVAYKVLK